jgi:hypothetical protein
MFGNNPQHTGESTVTLGNHLPVKVWERSFGTSRLNGVSVGGGRVFVTPYIYFNETKIFALNALTGDPLWDRSFPPRAFSINPPTYYNGKVYSWVSGNLREHDSATGERLRGVDFAMGDGELFAIDLRSFTELWKVPGTGLGTTPAISAGQVFAPSGKEVRAYDALTGALQQTFVAPDTLLPEQPLVTDDTVIVSSAQETYLFNRASAKLDHTIAAGGKLALADHVLYIASGTGQLHAWPLPTCACFEISLAEEPAHGEVSFTSSMVRPGESVMVRVQTLYGFVIDQIMINGVAHPMDWDGIKSYEFVLSTVTESMEIEVSFNYGREASFDAVRIDRGGEDAWVVSVFGRVGSSYQLERASDGVNWMPVGGVVAGADLLLELDDTPAGAPRMFYRVVEEQD